MTRVKVIKHDEQRLRDSKSLIKQEIDAFIRDKHVLQMSRACNPLGIYTTIIYEIIE